MKPLNPPMRDSESVSVNGSWEVKLNNQSFWKVIYDTNIRMLGLGNRTILWTWWTDACHSTDAEVRQVYLTRCMEELFWHLQQKGNFH